MLAPQIESSPQVRVKIKNIFQTPTVLEVPLTPNQNFTMKTSQHEGFFFRKKIKLLQIKIHHSSSVFRFQAKFNLGQISVSVCQCVREGKFLEGK